VAPGGIRSGIEDLALLQLEFGVVEDPGVVQLAKLAQLRELGVGVGPRLRRSRLSLIGTRLSLIRTLPWPSPRRRLSG
jgi:hypothetical protein